MSYQQSNMTNYNYYIYILYKNNKNPTFLVTLVLLLMLALPSYSQTQTEIQLANEYLLKGEKEKALELYNDLAKNNANVPIIHNNYFNTLIDLSEFSAAEDYLKKIQKRDPNNLQYQLDYGFLLIRSGEVNKADRYLKDLINTYRSSIQHIKMIADYLAARSLTDYSVAALNEGRKTLNNPFLFSLELAMLYRIKGEKDLMVQEYLNYVTQSTANIQYVKNILQALITQPDELESLERLLYDKVQKNPDIEVYRDLLIWTSTQQKNFYAAFIQARAFDKRYNKEGDKSMEIAKVALANDDYDNATKIYQYVVKEFSAGQNYLMARLGLIHTREARVKNSFPVSPDSVKTLIDDYKAFIMQYPNSGYGMEALRNQALLYAYYLDEKDQAVELLNTLIANPRVNSTLQAKAKLDLGDIYLLKGESWESTLLYSQVEKTQKESPVAYEAKLKNAKLSYFKGDFLLAQEHLDILKEATTREIANDALELSLRIKENTAFDSTGAALKVYASVELLLYQNKIDEALNTLMLFKGNREIWMSVEDAFMLGSTSLNLFKEIKRGADSVLIENTLSFSSATIMDDVYWLEADIRMKKGEFQTSLDLLQKIRDEYPDDVLTDDAYFLQGEIYDRQLHDKDKAMEIYRDFLNLYPGSVYAAEARKRYRVLRGDFSEETHPQL